ncbi:MAG: ABC transporter permease subunit [Planctomycetia bacterium]|nr:MAG: ABC transporter permease subunit [Planctomycetia bacterium]
MTLLNDLSHTLWRLIPANPILVRVVTTGGRRPRQALIRGVYLGLLIAATFWGGMSIAGQTSLAELAKSSTQVFVIVSVLQLALTCLIAPIFAAGAITQEKDNNTFSILLTTPLSNAQIVLGSLLSRLYFVWVLLLSGLPIFCISMIYGGVTTREVFESFALAAATGLVTGALAILVGMARVGTRRTIFSFVVGVAAYLLAVGLVGISPWGALREATPGVGGGVMSWLAPVHPFLALGVVTGRTPAPDPGEVAHYGWPASWLLAEPALGYVVITVLLSAVFIVMSLVFVRRGQSEGEATLLNRISGLVARRDVGERRRKPRRVWSNPIAWREAATKASAGGRSASRWVFVAIGAVAALTALAAIRGRWWGLSPAAAGPTLTALLWIEFGVILLVVTSTAASALTREKESQTMELLLATRLTSDYICAGMLQGLVRFVVPMLAVPAVTVLLFTLNDLVSPAAMRLGTPLESVLTVPALMVSVTALAAIIGLQFSLTSRRTIQAVMWSSVIVMAAAGLTWACGFAIRDAGPNVDAVLWPLLPFPSIQASVHPASMFPAHLGPPQAHELTSARWIRAVFAIVAAVLYSGLTWVLYRNMVKNFDMTVRRQSA